MSQVLPEVLQNWDISSRLEWLVTNGIGGYGSSSLAGANTRRYHGLLVAACKPPLGRTVILSKLDEEIRIEDQIYSLGANKYPSIIYPQGYRHLAGFTYDPVPTFLYSLHEDSVQVEKKIWMAHGTNSVFVQYTLLKAPEPVSVSLSPLMAYKDYHTEQRRWDGFTADLSIFPDHITFTACEGAIPVQMALRQGPWFTFEREPNWFFNFEHEREQERGLDAFEDLFCPGKYTGSLAAGESIVFVASLDKLESLSNSALDDEIARKAMLLRTAGVTNKCDQNIRALVLAADQFVIPKSEVVDRATIIAGYHWFADWGRDTMIALRGLCLSTGRYTVARDILLSFANALNDGLIPNRFTDDGSGREFNTVDATLWLFEASYRYASLSGDWKFLTESLYEPLEKSITAHQKGTRYNILEDAKDGLLFAGQSGIQLTWMDATVGDYVVTPRIGKPVEIQALWYNALRIMAEIAKRAGKKGDTYEAVAEKAKASFAARFINQDTSCLYDVIDGPDGDDGSIRPNQLFTLSLSFPILDPKSPAAVAVVEVATEHLLTPVGLRTLSPTCPGYIGTYGPGGQLRRDSAYHMGTIWPWLIGAYVDACRAVKGDGAVALLSDQIPTMLTRYGIGSIAEIFDGDEPHNPNGCIAQAWSVAELLRVLLDSVAPGTGAKTRAIQKTSRK